MLQTPVTHVTNYRFSVSNSFNTSRRKNSLSFSFSILFKKHKNKSREIRRKFFFSGIPDRPSDFSSRTCSLNDNVNDKPTISVSFYRDSYTYIYNASRDAQSPVSPVAYGWLAIVVAVSVLSPGTKAHGHSERIFRPDDDHDRQRCQADRHGSIPRADGKLPRKRQGGRD